MKIMHYLDWYKIRSLGNQKLNLKLKILGKWDLLSTTQTITGLRTLKVS